MNAFAWRARGRRVRQVAWRSMPPFLTSWLGRRLGIGHDRWEARRHVADVEPIVQRYRHTRPVGPLRHRIGVTVSPRHPDAGALRAAAQELGGEVRFFDPDDPDWPEQVLSSGQHGHLVRLRHGSSVERDLDGARLELLHLMGVPAWPNRVEAYLYEDKARSAWLLQARGVPHVPTHTFTRTADAIAFLNETSYPIVVKTRLGASGSGVERIDDRRAAQALARVCIDGRWQRRAADPRDADFGYFTVQPFIANAREFRVIRLGDVFFAHGKASAPGGWRYSGSGRRDWELPGVRVLDAGASVMEHLGIACGAVDLLEGPDGRWAVLEVQTWYEGFRAAQMDVAGVPSLARRTRDGWRFEEGAPHVHRGHALRLLALDAFLADPSLRRPERPSDGEPNGAAAAPGQ